MARATDTSVSRVISLADPGHLLSLGLGAGLIPKAPGTWGSLLALPVFVVLNPYGQAIYVACVITLLIVGVYLSGRTARALGVHDHSAIVIDEVVGMLVTWIGVDPDAFTIVAGFVLFRFFDIVKPWPIHRIEAGFSGGTGIMLDDVAAGLMAAAVLQLLLYYPPLAFVGAN